ncbi:ATP-binding cassette sub-family G member 5 [Arctopsyche grandis]|uniref:ATP-binding cassette sub-family G member 5 n=1 Tax=Arctopsyche grandis TaxID=121162 RepID=UPI00406D9E67
MIASEYTLELCNIFHSGQVEPGSCTQKLTGNIKTGVILKDVSLTVYNGEVVAVLGSKGSGKRALLDVIARRVSSRGQVLLNGSPLSLSQFRSSCGYVQHSCDFIPGLTVQQTLNYTAVKLSGYLKSSKVKQVLADLALSQVANRCVENLSKSEYRRLMIGVQLIRDPVILLLDEPTWDLDPLNTYLVVSILSNAAKKYGAAIILTMEKPRSDVFPFLDRVVYLCLGDVVYAGPTRTLLDYFGSIGFPCPQLENPLMYYLCLSTVDRRSRERFIESNHQIAALVEKFKMEGHAIIQSSSNEPHRMMNPNKMQLSYGKPSELRVVWLLYIRMLASIFSFKQSGMKQIFLRLFTMPIYFFILWLFYNDLKDYQRTFITRSGLLFNCMVGVYFISIVNTILTYAPYRTRYYQEAQEGLYSGASLLLSCNLVSLPFSFISIAASTAIIYPLVGDITEALDYLYIVLALWACYIFAEQQTMAILMLIKCSILASTISICITCVYIMLSSGILRSYNGLEDWLYYLTYATQTRYTSSFLQRKIFSQDIFNGLPSSRLQNCTDSSVLTQSSLQDAGNANCLFRNGKAFLMERFGHKYSSPDIYLIGEFNLEFNLGISFAFAVGSIVVNKLFYLMPLPSFLKAKFRE